MTFADLKRGRATSFEKLNNELSKLNTPQYEADTRYWRQTVDKAGNAYAIIRFLPEPAGEDVPFVRLWNHAFQGPNGMWYIENSRTTLSMEDPDPMAEHNRELWNSGIKANQELVSKERKRKLNYISNILVIKDPSNPENEGKVFLYKYGKKIFDKLNDQMHPQFPDQPRYNPFDLWDGANFVLRQRKQDGFPNYDASTFEAPAAVYDSDAKLEALYNSLYPLQPEVAPSKFKSYEELKKRLDRVLGAEPAPRRAVAETENDDTPPWDEPKTTSSLKERLAKPLPTAAAKSTIPDDDEDDDLALFQKLAEE